MSNDTIDPFTALPPEIMLNIFTFLDAHSVLNCELVSRSWHTLASAQHIWKRVFLSEFKAPHHSNLCGLTRSEVNTYREMSWKRRWRVNLALSKRWVSGTAGAFYLEGHSDNIYCVQFDDEKIVTGSKDRTIRIWSTRSHRCIHVLGLPTKDFDPQDMERLPQSPYPVPLTVKCSASRPSYEPERFSLAHDGSILCLQYDDRILVTGSSDCSLILWIRDSDFHFRPVKRLAAHSKGVLDVCFDEQQIVSCSKDNSICLWGRKDTQLHKTLTGHRGPVNAVRLKGDLIASASGDGLVKLWNRCSGLCIKEFSSTSRGLACVELSFDSRMIWAGGNDHDIYEFNTNTGMLASKLGTHSSLVRSLYLDGNCGRLLSGSYDNNIKVFPIGSKAGMLNFKNWSASWILSVKADYRRIVATTQDRRIIVIDFGYGLDGIGVLDQGCRGVIYSLSDPPLEV